MRPSLFPCLATALLITSPVRAAKQFDPCNLIKPWEIEAVVGERLVNTKPSRPETGELDVSLCFYALGTFAKSVSLEVVRRKPADPAAPSPRERWDKLFAEPARIGGEEGEAESSLPEKVADLGDEALWIRHRVGGALYVLKGEAYLRISVGGAGPESIRLRKSKELARKALGRL